MAKRYPSVVGRYDGDDCPRSPRASRCRRLPARIHRSLEHRARRNRSRGRELSSTRGVPGRVLTSRPPAESLGCARHEPLDLLGVANVRWHVAASLSRALPARVERRSPVRLGASAIGPSLRDRQRHSPWPAPNGAAAGERMDLRRISGRTESRFLLRRGRLPRVPHSPTLTTKPLVSAAAAGPAASRRFPVSGLATFIGHPALEGSIRF